MVLTYVAIAEDPVQSETMKLIDTTSARPPAKIRSSAGFTVESTASGTITCLAPRRTALSMSCTVSWPRLPLKKPRIPTIPSSIDGSEISCQNPASAASPSTRSRHARPNVDAVSCQTMPMPRPRAGSACSVSLTTVAIGDNGTACGPLLCDTRRVVSTHDVQNQPPPLDGYDVYSADIALTEAVARHE